VSVVEQVLVLDEPWRFAIDGGTAARRLFADRT